MKKIIFLAVCICFFITTYAANVDTVLISSEGMHRDIKAVVIKPADYGKTKRFPVVYLLHGATGNFSNWITKVPALQEMATQYQVLIVCPDGSNNSWYFDSPVDTAYRFETHVSTEVPKYIDDHYRTIADRKHRAIAGLSMGGHGAFFIAFRHAETFGACGSMSGVLDIGQAKGHYDMDKRLGDTINNAHFYTDWSVLKQVDNYPKDSLAIILDCGRQDGLYFMSKAVHERLAQLNIPHDYIERPGQHDWAYWANAVKYQMLFFHDFFVKGD